MKHIELARSDMRKISQALYVGEKQDLRKTAEQFMRLAKAEYLRLHDSASAREFFATAKKPRLLTKSVMAKKS